MMTDTSSSSSSSSARAALRAMPPILLGIALYVVGRPFDGFVGGFFAGAAIALEILGAYILGHALWSRDHDDRRTWWLPSTGDPSDQWLPSHDETVTPEHETTPGGDDR